MIDEKRFEELEKKVESLFQTKDSIEFSVEKTMDSVGRITIPKSIRKILGWEEESVEVRVSVQGDHLIIERI